MTEPVYFGKLMPERERMAVGLVDLIRPRLGDLKVGESEGFRFIGIERENSYAAIAERRIANVAPLFREEPA